MKLDVYNPLPSAYAHREEQLRSTLGTEINFYRSFNENLRGGQKVFAVLRHIATVRSLLRSERPVLVLWPLLGWLELLLWASRKDNVYVSFHDPRPLRRQFGLGRFSLSLVRIFPGSFLPNVICHSSVGRDVMVESVPNINVTTLPLPMLEPKTTLRSSVNRVVLVLGQYKPARDLELLNGLRPFLSSNRIEGRIVGRGWPPVSGWTVRNGFLSESEFDREILSAGCVLVPYRHYFQSGVALRALELGVPVVGANHPFLTESLCLASSPGIVYSPDDLSSWLHAIEASIGSVTRGDAQYKAVKSKWSRWYSEASSLS